MSLIDDMEKELQEDHHKHILICPHGFELTRINVLGLLSYNHPNGKGCMLMNILNTSPDASCKQLVLRSGIVETPSFIASISVSKVAREEVYKTLATADDLKLVQGIITYLRAIKKCVFSESSLYKELVETFGNPIIVNARLVDGIILEKQSKPCKMKMKVLDAKFVSDVTGTKSHQRRLDETKLSSIIYGLSDD